jgi:hypothetical protein
MAEPKELLNAIGHFLIDLLKETGKLQKLLAARYKWLTDEIR